MGLLGSSTKSDKAEGHSSAAINSSGWVVGSGSANGGSMSAAGGPLPWYAWASMGAVAFYWYWKKKGR